MVTTAYINIWNKRVGAIAWDAYAIETSVTKDVKEAITKTLLLL